MYKSWDQKYPRSGCRVRDQFEIVLVNRSYKSLPVRRPGSSRVSSASKTLHNNHLTLFQLWFWNSLYFINSMFSSHYSLLWTPIITNKPVANLYRDVRFILDVYLNIQPRPISSAARLSQDWLVSPDPSQEYQNRGLSEPQRVVYCDPSMIREMVW